MPSPSQYPEKNALIQKEFYADLKSIIFKESIKEIFDKVLKTVNKMGWELISDDIDEGQIEAVASSLFFGFKDEVVIRIKEINNKVVVDIRSRSRIGKIDRGANARRIKKFIIELKKLDNYNESK
jgi:uncharacterized protein (DUF1499 family)